LDLTNRAASLHRVGIGLQYDVDFGGVDGAIVGGILAGILCFLVLREIEQRREKRRR